MYVYTYTYAERVCPTCMLSSYHGARGKLDPLWVQKVINLTSCEHKTLDTNWYDSRSRASLCVSTRRVWIQRISSLISSLLSTWGFTREPASVRRERRKKATGDHPDCCEGRSPPISSEISRLAVRSTANVYSAIKWIKLLLSVIARNYVKLGLRRVCGVPINQRNLIMDRDKEIAWEETWAMFSASSHNAYPPNSRIYVEEYSRKFATRSFPLGQLSDYLGQ